MRETDRKNGFSLQAISGTRAVMLAMNANQDHLDDFLGFAVGTRSGDGEIHWLRGFKYFPSLYPTPPVGSVSARPNTPSRISNGVFTGLSQKRTTTLSCVRSSGLTTAT